MGIAQLPMASKNRTQQIICFQSGAIPLPSLVRVVYVLFLSDVCEKMAAGEGVYELKPRKSFQLYYKHMFWWVVWLLHICNTLSLF